MDGNSDYQRGYDDGYADAVCDTLAAFSRYFAGSDDAGYAAYLDSIAAALRDARTSDRLAPQRTADGRPRG